MKHKFFQDDFTIVKQMFEGILESAYLYARGFAWLAVFVGPADTSSAHTHTHINAKCIIQ